MKSIEYRKYYESNLDDANEFQDFICISLMQRGIVLSNMSSKKYQYNYGENIQGFEIKLDKKFRESGNLYIEYKEKSDPNNVNYVDSGIVRNDNSWIYCVGDYKGIYLMQKSVLVAMKKGINKYRHVETPTSKGYLLPVSDADKYFTYIEFLRNEVK